MRYSKIKKTALIILIISLFALFHIAKFIEARISNTDLPMGKIVFFSPLDGDYEIYTMNINGLNLKQLTKNSASVTDSAIDDEPSFSLDGRKIVFSSGRQGKDREFIYDYRGRVIGTGSTKTGTSDIYIMDSDGKNQTPLTYKGLNFSPFFSPDAKKIIFKTLFIDNHRENLVKMIDIDGSGKRILNFGGGQVEFSSDGKMIFDNFQADVSVLDISGANRKRLTHLNDNKEPKLGIQFAISPDDGKLAVITSETRKLLRPDSIDDFYDIFEFYIMNIDGSGSENIYRIDGSELDEIYKSNEKEISSGDFTIQGYERLPDGTFKEKVYRTSDLKGGVGTIWQCKLSSDGKYLIFHANFGGKNGIYLLNLEDKTVVSLTDKKEKWFDILDFTFTPNGKRIVFVAGISPKIYYSKAMPAVIFRIFKSYIYYFLLRKDPFPITQYICIMDIDGKNYRRITKLPVGTELGRDFIHWEE